MSDGYSTQIDYINWVKSDADDRQSKIGDALKKAFSEFIEERPVEVIVFSNMTAIDLSDAIIKAPEILKPLLAICNVAARAIERDLSIKNIDTYKPRLTNDEAKVISGYIKPFLPSFLELPTLIQTDRMAFIDKEIRKAKGRWEKKIIESLNKFSEGTFQKRMFTYNEERFEIDAAHPVSGDIKIGVDIKRIEARKDIHKRCDEIVNKASKLKSHASTAKFAVVIYYPFIDEHINVQSRLKSENIDTVVFANETDESIENNVRLLLSTLGFKKND